ncbi:MAG: hypothetical protein K8T90_20570, partial [Planctomycetes bacterium]|nr:hypothetical protein [Planctomycetota bacterium]
LDAATGAVRWRTTLRPDGRTLPRPEILQGVVAYEMNVKKPEGYDCRVAFVSRQDGSVTDTIRHPSIGNSLQRAFFQGPFVILWAPPRADVAVYGAAPPAAPK